MEQNTAWKQKSKQNKAIYGNSFPHKQEMNSFKKKGKTIDNVVAKRQLIVNKAWSVSRSLHAINQKGVFFHIGWNVTSLLKVL